MVGLTSEYDQRQMDLIMTGEQLDDDHIDRFTEVFNEVAGPAFMMQPQVYLYFPHEIMPVASHQKHIQLLYSCSELVRADGKPPKNGHWVCSYYDSKRIHIYNSIGTKSLHPHHKIYLEKLFPFYDFNKTNAVSFPSVDKQSNNNDCGLFSIAFAISILYGLKPENVRYCQQKMRSHLVTILKSKQIEHFPRTTFDSNVVASLTDVQKKRKAAVAKTAWRMRNKKSCTEHSQVQVAQIGIVNQQDQLIEKRKNLFDVLHNNNNSCDHVSNGNHNKRKRTESNFNDAVSLNNITNVSHSMTIDTAVDKEIKRKKKAAEKKARWRAKRKIRVQSSATLESSTDHCIPLINTHNNSCDHVSNGNNNKRKRTESNFNDAVSLNNITNVSHSMTIDTAVDKEIKRKKKAAEKKARWRAKRKIRVQSSATLESSTDHCIPLMNTHHAIPMATLNDKDNQTKTLNVRSHMIEDVVVDTSKNSKYSIIAQSELDGKTMVIDKSTRRNRNTSLHINHPANVTNDTNAEVIIIDDSVTS